MKLKSHQTRHVRVSHPRLLLCVKNEGYQASLEVRKIYKAIPDPAAAVEGLIRIVDESGEDYLYPNSFFETIQLAAPLRRNLLQHA